MMSVPTTSPDQSLVDEICDICGIDAAQAGVLARKYPSLEQAIQHYFDDSVEALRDDRGWEPQDNIPFNDAPSRPSSTINHLIDLSEEHAQASSQLKEQEGHEADEYNRAVAASLGGAVQRAGVPTTNQHFGPAQRQHYNPDQWAVTLPRTSTREIVEQPPPRKRRRIQGQPAFLTGSPETGYLASALNIYHSIPLARHALLSAPVPTKISTYGAEWWAGKIANRELIWQVTSTTEDSQAYLSEMQCLMAFLDSTSRAYGSADVLQEVKAWQYSMGARLPAPRALEVWHQSYTHLLSDDSLNQVFESVAMKNAPLGPEVQAMVQVDGHTNASMNEKNQGQLLDKILWNDVDSAEIDDVWFDQIAPVFTMLIQNTDENVTGLGLPVSNVWHLDRYSSDFREVSRQMRLQCVELGAQHRRLQMIQNKLICARGPDNSEIDLRQTIRKAADLLPVATEGTARKEQYLIGDHQQYNTVELREAMDELASRIQEKLDILEAQKDDILQQIDHVRSDLTDPATSTHPLQQRYELHGVSTKPTITYMRHRNPDLIDVNEDEASHENGIWQWWRAAWNDSTGEAEQNDNLKDMGTSDDRMPYTIRRVKESEVLQAIQTESSTVMLVYASQTALNSSPMPLTPALKEFVNYDNQLFEDEVRASFPQNSQSSRSINITNNSQVTQIADPFSDHTYRHNEHISDSQNITPVTSNSSRSVEGEPSPKRPRSSEDSSSSMDVELPPSYESVTGSGMQPEMTERKGNNVGKHADAMSGEYSGSPDRPSNSSIR